MDVPEAAAVKQAFVNASRSKVASMTMPATWPPARSDDRDFIGWTDPKAPRRAYLVLRSAASEEWMTIELRLPSPAGGRTRKTMCDLCQSTDAPDGAVLMVAPRAGARGRAGDSVGICLCTDFDCSLRAREALTGHRIPVSERPDDRVPQLVERLNDFADRVRS